jgi:uncharacterized membrane protein
MKKYIGIVTVLILMVFVSSCYEPSNSAEYSVSILSVSPDTALIDGTVTEFTIEVEYSILNASQGEINIGFNDGDLINIFYIYDDLIVSEGSGTHTFIVTATAKDWLEGDFEVYANIVEYPHSSSYSPKDTDFYILTF